MKIAIACSYGLLLSASAWAQNLQSPSQADTIAPSRKAVVQNNISLSGRLIDAKTQQPISGALVHIKGTTHEVQTGANGEFAFLTGQKVPVIYQISALGYKLKEFYADKAHTGNIALEELNTQLNDVVVVGYGTQKRRDLTSAIASIKGSEVVTAPVASFDAQLQGRAAGVQINSNTGVPGDGVFVRVRGTSSINADNDPLYIIDGVFINNSSLQTVNTGGRSTSPLADLNPADIENIEVLKDASATAIYGSRGANGVVIVTTRRGKYNAKAKLNLDVSAGAAWAPKLWDLTTGPQHAELINEFYANSLADAQKLGDQAGIKKYSVLPFRALADQPNAQPAPRGLPSEQKTYDRLNEIFRTAPLQNYNLSLAGGNKDTRYYFGGGYSKQQAILKPIGFERASFKLNLDQRINDRITIGSSNSFSRSFRAQGRAGDGPQGGLLQAALHTPTYLPETNADGTPARWAGFDNVQVLIDNYDVHTTSLRYIGNLFLDAEVLPDLKFHSQISIDYNNYNESEYWNNLTQLGGGSTNGLATSAITQSTSWINEQTLTWRKQLATKHFLGVLIGNTLQSNTETLTAAQGSGFPNNAYKLISSAATRTSSQTWTRNNLASFFSRIDYNYAGKYYFEASLRADGSSKFGDNVKWGYFPSVSGSWRLKEENFLKEVKGISDLKLRLSYGVTGNQSGISNFAAKGLWSGGSGYPDNSSGDQPGTTPLQLPNQNLQWERTSQTNFGVDLGLFKGRVNLTADIYSKYTSNLLLQLPKAGVTGFSSYYSNAGEISNKGYEIGINTTNISTRNLTWTTSFNIAGNKNKIEKLPSPIYQYNRDWIIMQEGSPMYSFWLYKQLGVDPNTGDVIFEGAKDGKLPVSARQVMGNAMPDFYGGLSNTVTWNGFDLSVFFSFQYGNEVYNLNKFFGEGGGTRDANRVLFADQLNRWQKPGDQTDVPRLTAYGLNYTIDQNSRFLEDGSFLRLKSLTLGYTIPKSITERWKIQQLRVYFIGSNLWLLTKYTGLDPESNVTGLQTVQGLDLGTPPQPRSVQFGVNVTL
ncbi:TonB-linked SusC/RagA family outer membrane protein [Chitinophaga terrae (ex Kim and Jung 2007)]|uniref:SusC/RagA family TonB-linked outer membrane protein n=1 Tax=Chitinophaga terrae (ex Kim and Jung 2007) TaxID=408074 RepID=UPI0027811549|nr:TonB-dependent receptor [Chitinophaga terrae (ex Kim and Jung 2007)]MDQ0106494.1 TonB-linked SusC/RagA family outer membrane protein [Chitinophaga terrae (ex Kim and Jung 2007)]